MIIDRYIIHEIAKPMIALCAILVIIFASYSAAVYLTEAADGLLPMQTVLSLILLKTFIAFEVLLPVALYLSVVMGLGRLYSDHEMAALAAAGVSEMRILQAVLRLSLLAAVMVGCLSLYARPWAYQKGYELEAQAEAEFDLNKLQSSHFYQSGQSNRTIFVEKIDRNRNYMEQVFIKREGVKGPRIIVAEEAYQPSNSPESSPVLVFLRGYAYDLDRDGNKDHILKFNELTLRLDGYEAAPVGYKRKAAPTMQLVHSDEPKDIAEFQWRFSTPLATVLLSLLGIPVSRAAPRQGKYAKMLAAVLIFAVFYNLSAMAMTWVEEGVVGAVPGIWWTDVLLAGLLVALLRQPSWTFWLRRRFRRIEPRDDTGNVA